MALVSTSRIQVPIYFGVVVLEKVFSGGSVQRIFRAGVQTRPATKVFFGRG